MNAFESLSMEVLYEPTSKVTFISINCTVRYPGHTDYKSQKGRIRPRTKLDSNLQMKEESDSDSQRWYQPGWIGRYGAGRDLLRTKMLDKEPKFCQAGMAAVADPENRTLS